jgi:heme/copper-type cytochrome/quinol oxidase subunit 3
MAETTTPSAMSPAEEEAVYYHESALNSAWTGARLAAGGLSFLFGSFVFAFFYLKSLNSHGLWYTSGTHPKAWLGVLIMLLIVVSALVQTAVLQMIKRGNKSAWQSGAVVALVLGLASVAFSIYQLLDLPFWPGASGFASVFVGYWPVYLTIVFCAMVWLEILIMRARTIPQISFVEQPPTYAEAFAVQRFQASLSGFTLIWNYLAVVAIIAWILFYLVH